MYQRRDFYRHARYVHGWLSAFAFIALFFFSITGLFLNNPSWFETKKEEQVYRLQLPPELTKQLIAEENPTTPLLSYIRQHQDVIGRYQSSEVMDQELMIRLESPAGSTDIWAMIDTGEVEITNKEASTVSLINDLHRGKNSGVAWSWFIDIVSILILTLSIAGYILFLTLKTRLMTNLMLTAISLAVLMLFIWSAV